MSYFSGSFLFLIVPIIALIYNLIPKKREWFLLLANFFVYYLMGKYRLIFLILSIISVYFSALLIKKEDEKKEVLLKNKNADKKLINQKIKKRKKLILILCILFNVSFLIVFKYLGFLTLNINGLLNILKIKHQIQIVNFIAPIGISFYTLSALSYLIDVYNGRVDASKSFVKVALFLSFFPQIMEGPISRFTDTADDLASGKKIKHDNLVLGYQRMMYGLFKKKLLVDRINPLVKSIFNNYYSYNGLTVFLGAVAYTVMLYMEFSGTMDIVIGSGQIFGINIKENFRQPFFSKNISEFWTRWHISLGTWFKDYIYYPISLSKPLKKLTVKLRHKLGNHYGPLVSGTIALFVVWFLNGLWHGAGYTYLLFGLYHFIMIAFGNFVSPLIIKICEKLKINRENTIYRVLQSIKMSIFVFLGEMIFRANSVKDAALMFKKIFTNFKFNFSELSILGLDIYDYIIVLLTIIVVFIISFLKEKNINVNEKLYGKKLWIRWIIYYVLILAIYIFGAYGPGYEPLDPIYADF